MELKGSLPYVSYSYSIQSAHTTLSEQYPYMGYRLGLWMSTDLLVKMVEPLAQQNEAHKMKLKSTQSIAFNILTFYEVMDMCFN
jgi:hypothetical protein